MPGRPFLRAGTLVGANYRAVCHAKSDADFISKMGAVVEETDESAFQLEFMENAGVCNNAQIQPLKTEANELLSVFSTSLTTAKRNAGRRFSLTNPQPTNSMMGFRFIKVQPTTYLLQYRCGKVVREGLGLSFFYYLGHARLHAFFANNN